MDAPLQKLMNDRATVVATTTFAVVVDGLTTSEDIDESGGFQALSTVATVDVCGGLSGLVHPAQSE